MSRVLLIDKPKGWTSFDVVARIRNTLRSASSQSSVDSGLKNNTQETNHKKRSTGNNQQKTNSQKRIKVGHAGTLDPLATGLLIVLVGDECKNQDNYMKLDKIYEVEMKLGETSTTEDGEGKISKVSDDIPSEAIVKQSLRKFIGEISQTPPIYSAIKVKGQRAYKLARKGQDIRLEPRKVTINSITDIDYNYPRISFITSVSSGTYIRSLVKDIGENLATGAYMTNLRRTKIGDYKLESAQDIDSILVSISK